ncbi:MAG: Mov34/MPN/PAD-1 family protein [Candidatus Bathyarchaeota archaeon]
MIIMNPEAFMAMQEFAKNNHPNEIIVLLRGSRKGDDFIITDFLLPPFGSGGHGFASFPVHMLPIDFTIMGTAHSHPSGVLKPSTGDFHNFYGRIMMILGPPYDQPRAAVYYKSGEQIPVKLASPLR